VVCSAPRRGRYAGNDFARVLGEDRRGWRGKTAWRGVYGLKSANHDIPLRGSATIALLTVFGYVQELKTSKQADSYDVLLHSGHWDDQRTAYPAIMGEPQKYGPTETAKHAQLSSIASDRPGSRGKPGRRLPFGLSPRPFVPSPSLSNTWALSRSRRVELYSCPVVLELTVYAKLAAIGSHRRIWTQADGGRRTFGQKSKARLNNYTSRVGKHRQMWCTAIVEEHKR